MPWQRADLIAQVPSLASGQVDDDLVVFCPATGTSLGLSGTGVWLWRMLASPLTLGDLIAAATDQFQVPRSVCAPDIVATLDLLRQHGLIHVEHR